MSGELNLEEPTEQDTSLNLPIYLCSPTPELAGLKLFKHKLYRTFRDSLPYKWQCRLEESTRTHLKSGSRVRLQEALTMDFISRNTTIPVPRVLDVFTIEGTVYIVQERIRGPVLEDVWRHLSPKSRQSCIVQIKGYLDQLRVLKPPDPERVQALDGSAVSDHRISNDPYGPFDNHDDFHRFLRHDFYRRNPDKYKAIQEPLAKMSAKKYRTVFSHGDFGPHNLILKTKAGKSKLYLIDWEMAGWFPEYWEYARAHAVRSHYKIWWDIFDEAVDSYDDEVEVQLHSSSYFHFYLR